jgi:hypothetical protein
MLNQVLDLAISREQYIDLCNVTEIIKERQLADIFAMTWRWASLLGNLITVSQQIFNNLLLHQTYICTPCRASTPPPTK